MGTILKTRPIQEPAWGPGGNSSNLWVSPALLSLDIEEGDNLVGQLTKYSFTTGILVELIFALGWTRLLWTRHKTAPQLPPQQQVGGKGEKRVIYFVFFGPAIVLFECYLNMMRRCSQASPTSRQHWRPRGRRSPSRLPTRPTPPPRSPVTNPMHCRPWWWYFVSQGVMMQAAYPGQQFQVSGQPTTIAL